MQMSPFRQLEDVKEEEEIVVDNLSKESGEVGNNLSKSSVENPDPFSVENDEFPTIIQNESKEKGEMNSSITKDVQLFLEQDKFGLTNNLEELLQPVHADKSSISILPDEEQKAFEDKMDMYLLGGQAAPTYAA